MNLEIIKKFGDLQERFYSETDTSDGLIGFNSDEGQWVINPFKSKCLRYNVNPLEYYNKESFEYF
ncbi:hypothetical protein NSA23_05405 [Anaerosalibacter massiliensis]|uniref:Uncharacterized protein n=1 Tax=Anaerosalibacter massiliensis TaxID=1347392 RepID=A0A9X2MEK3_9FIRM|nr:hypothetical protein [Anaerosalibacter massiliensis]MCR2043552.1 hypothetical protein [Anaerosalibacter massiliensis]